MKVQSKGRQLLKACVLFNTAILFPISQVFAQAPPIQWQKSIGGISQDVGTCIRQTLDNGYIIAGVTSSSDGDVTGYHGSGDAFIAKLDNNGVIQWKKCYGGTGDEAGYGIVIEQTSDNGFIFTCNSTSTDGDVTANNGNDDIWVVKTDATGTILWQKSYGTVDIDIPHAIQQTTDGGYVVAGGKDRDLWIIKLDASGVEQWQKTYGGSMPDIAISIEQISGGGYIVGGRTESTDNDVTGNHGGSDFWLLKLDNNGNKLSAKCFGGSSLDELEAMHQTSDGGVIMCGYTKSMDGDVTGNKGSDDYWIVKLDASTNIQWQKALGSSKHDAAMDVWQDAQGGFIVAGYTEGNDSDVTGNHGTDHVDYWIVRLSNTGNVDWKKCYGGTWDEMAYSIRPTKDGGYVIGGYAMSTDGDVTGNHLMQDYWVVKLGSSTGINELEASSNISVMPNPNNGRFTVRLISASNEVVSVSITNIYGQIIKTLQGATNEDLNINLDVPAGVYLVHVVSADSKQTQKIIIQ